MLVEFVVVEVHVKDDAVDEEELEVGEEVEFVIVMVVVGSEPEVVVLGSMVVLDEVVEGADVEAIIVDDCIELAVVVAVADIDGVVDGVDDEVEELLERAK